MSAGTISLNELSTLLSTSGIKTIVSDTPKNVGVMINMPNDTVGCNKPCTSKRSARAEQPTKEKKMYDNDYMEMMPNPTTELERKAEYFQNELRIASFKKRDALEAQFKLNMPKEPNSPKELVQWFKDGWFEFSKRLNDDGSWREDYLSTYDMVDRFIIWKNPNRDEAGYNAAIAKLDEVTRKTARQITATSTPAEMLKYLEEFEATTIN